MYVCQRATPIVLASAAAARAVSLRIGGNLDKIPRTAVLVTTISAELVRRSAAYELCKRSFPDFLRQCIIQSDDALSPSDIPFEPYDYQLERALAWQAHTSEAVLKARQLGFTWELAAYKLWRALLHNWNVAYYSRGEDEARAQIDRRVMYIFDRLPAWLRGPAPRRRDMYVLFPGGGSIRAFPSTESAGISYTFQLIVADECAFHRYAAQNYAAYSPTISAGGQFIATSTADPQLGPSGFFYDLYNAAVEHKNSYSAVFVPWHVRPGRDGTWLEKERERFHGLANEFDAYYPETPEDAFRGRSGLVFPQFSPSRHVRAEAPCLWEDTLARYAGYDLGGGDPTAIVVLGVYRDSGGTRRVHQFGEAYWPRGVPTVGQIAQYLMKWHERAPFTHVERDPVGATSTVAMSLASLGLPCRQERISNSKADRLGIHAYYLDHDLLTIDASCTYSIGEYTGYRWANRIDPNDRSRYQTQTPVDNHGDAIDARGQTLVAVYRNDFVPSSQQFLKVVW